MTKQKSFTYCNNISLAQLYDSFPQMIKKSQLSDCCVQDEFFCSAVLSLSKSKCIVNSFI